MQTLINIILEFIAKHFGENLSKIWKLSIKIDVKYLILIGVCGFGIPSIIQLFDTPTKHLIPSQTWKAYDVIDYSLEDEITPDYTIGFQDGIFGKYLKAKNVLLQSSQDQDGNTVVNESIAFILMDPNTITRNNLPFRGTSANLKIDSVKDISKNKETLIYCHYAIDYNDWKNKITYIGNSQYIPLGEWVNLVWDFSGKIEKGTFAKINKDQQTSQYIDDFEKYLKDNNLNYSWVSRRLNEQWFYSALSTSPSFDPNNISNLRLTCNLNSSSDFIGKNNSTLKFIGNFTLGKAFIYP